MEDIAALAEVGKGTLYRYFDDKEQLYLALLQQASVGMQSRISDAISHKTSPHAQLVAVVEAVLGYFDEQPYVFELILHAEALQRPGQLFPWQKTRDHATALVREILVAGKRLGEFDVGDPDLAMLVLLGGLRSVIRFGVRPRPADLAEKIVAGVLFGFSSPGGCARASR